MSTAFNLSTLIRANVAKLKPYSSARDEFKDFTTEMIFLDANENPFANGVNRYPDPQQKNLKSLLAQKKGVIADQVLLGNGSDEVLDLIFRAFCEPRKDSVITMPPTYGMYGVLAATNDITNKEILLTNNFDIDTEAVLKAISSNVKLIFICSPNNPSGNVLNKEAIKKLLENFEGLIVIDEAYVDFTEQESWVHCLAEYPNLIVTQTLSKAYGMAGIRLGICYASVEIIQVLNKIKPPYNVNILTQERAFLRVTNTTQVSLEIANIVAYRNELSSALKNIYFVSKVYDSEANFVLARVDNATKRYEQLLNLGIVVRNRSSQPLCDNCLRFTVGTKEENQKLIAALKNIN
ncbi:histidinol-phosphate transaminase [Ascidiimonas sp. W6]|uniref:histidinol-phosphate transaminase n=1 Tax=Ascidiimonas meishanensis TaxID=3128903 RepID=UPI0030EDD96E